MRSLMLVTLLLLMQNFDQLIQHARWGPEQEKTFQPPSLNCIQPDLSIDDLEYIIKLYCLDDINQKLQQPVDPKMDDTDLRSPSRGQKKRKLSTRGVCKYKQKNFVPPHDYKPLKKSKKIYLTNTLDAPDANYIGLILGQGGNTQKYLEGKTGCKISVRGNGSFNTKKVNWDMDDKLHMNNYNKVLRKQKKFPGNQEIEQARNARLQGQVIATVLRDDFCEYCHEKGHLKKLELDVIFGMNFLIQHLIVHKNLNIKKYLFNNNMINIGKTQAWKRKLKIFIRWQIQEKRTTEQELLSLQMLKLLSPYKIYNQKMIHW